MTIQELIAAKQADLEAENKRMAGLNALIDRSVQERQNLLADIIRDTGHLAGLSAALEVTPEKKKEPHAPGG